MEARGNSMSLDSSILDSWHAIGLSEGLETDADIAQFLIALYSSLKQREKSEVVTRCLKCHGPLTLHCSTCKNPVVVTPPAQKAASSQTPFLPQLSPPCEPVSVQSQSPKKSFPVQFSPAQRPEPLEIPASQNRQLLQTATPEQLVFPLKVPSLQSVPPHESPPLHCPKEALVLQSLPSEVSPSLTTSSTASHGQTASVVTGAVNDVTDSFSLLNASTTNLNASSQLQPDHRKLSNFEMHASRVGVAKSEYRQNRNTTESNWAEPTCHPVLTQNLFRGRQKSQKEINPVLDTASGIGKRKTSSKIGKRKTSSKMTYWTEKRTGRPKNRLHTIAKTPSSELRTQVEALSKISSDTCPKTADTVCAASDEKADHKLETEAKKSKQKSLFKLTEGSCGDYNKERTSQIGDRKRSCDLREGYIIPVKERELAQIHVYDDRCFERHVIQKDVARHHRRPKKKLIKKTCPADSTPECCGRRPSSPGLTNSVSSCPGQEKMNLNDGREQTNHSMKVKNNAVSKTDCTLMNQIMTDKDDSEENDAGCKDVNQTGSAHQISHTLGPKQPGPFKDKVKEPEDLGSSAMHSIKILVSAKKILPLRTENGKYMYLRSFYSFFECAHCQKAFSHKRAFNNHIQEHVGRKLHKCSVCGKGFERPCDRTRHERRHQNFVCVVCGEKFVEVQGLNEHMKLHTENGGIMKCSGCSFETTDYHAFEKHKYQCAHLKPTVQCEICGVHLKSMYALRFHIAAIHTNDRPFQCSLCEKRFVLKTKLNTHMKYRHAEGGRLFQCNQCSYSAFDARNLKMHQQCVHSMERPFKCMHCSSAFARKFYLTIHLRKHTGEKPHRCPECLQTFTQRPSLTRHRRSHHC